jgi:hypothetical protein
LVKVGQNGTDICLKLKVKLGKIWSIKVLDKRCSKLLKVMKWLAILTTLKLLFVCGEKIGSLAYLRRKILNLLMLVRKFFSDYAHVSPETFFDLPPPPRRQHLT